MAYPLRFRLEVLERQAETGESDGKAGKRYGISSGCIRKWRLTRDDWEAQAVMEREMETGEERAEVLIDRVLVKNLKYLLTDEAVGSVSHRRSSQIVFEMAKLQTGELDESSSTEADEWIKQNLRVYQGGRPESLD